MGSTKKHKDHIDDKEHRHKKRRRSRSHDELRNDQGNKMEKDLDKNTKKDNFESENGQEKLSLSIEETNKLRAKLGLKPLELNDDNNVAKNEEKKDVHVPAHNLGDIKRTDELREKLKQSKEKRKIEQSLTKVKPLAEDGSETVSSWVEKSRKLEFEKKQAEERAKILDEMDKEFGVESLIKEEFVKNASLKKYQSKDLKGLKIEHSDGHFEENKEIILTLKDKRILDNDDEDVLVNVNMIDDEKAAKNIENKKSKPIYNPYDEPEYDEYGILKQKEILSKYDEEINGGPEKKFILINNDGKINSNEKKIAQIRSKLEKHRENLILEKPVIASEYYTAEEMEMFKKPSKRIKKLRKKIKLTADDLLATDLNENKHQPRNESKVADGKAQKIPGLDLVNLETMENDDNMGPDDDLSGVVIEEDSAQLELELAIEKARKLNSQKPTKSLIDVVSVIKSEFTENNTINERMPYKESTFDFDSSAVVMNSTAEFCRSLGDLPMLTTNASKKNDEDDEENMEDDDDMRGKGWQSVEIDEKPVDLKQHDKHVLDEEPIVNQGIGAALKLASKKGYLDSIVTKLISAPRHSKLEAQNYSIEDKRMDDLDDKYSRKRDRYSGSGPVVDFKEKEGYKPEIKLEYVDDAGREMSKKEAFRYLSHKFHGKGSGKKKLEKRMKKAEEDVLMRSMSSTDTPLNTVQLLQERQKIHKLPYIVLSGSKGLTSNIITKH